jgi:hypothetical protein
MDLNKGMAFDSRGMLGHPQNWRRLELWCLLDACMSLLTTSVLFVDLLLDILL